MIEKAIQRAYQVAEERNWDRIYWAIDLHGVVFKSNYENGKYEFINEHARLALQYMSVLDENVLILWSSCHKEEQKDIITFMQENHIRISFFNENPEVKNTMTGCFDKKFYFSVLLDDKAGFDPEHDWNTITEYMSKRFFDKIPAINDLQS